jgi:hypothetical protein
LRELVTQSFEPISTATAEARLAFVQEWRQAANRQYDFSSFTPAPADPGVNPEIAGLLEMKMNRSWKVFGAAFSLLAMAAMNKGAAHTQSTAVEQARATTRDKGTALVPVYDVTKEIEVRGTIRKIDAFGVSGQAGTHILVETARGVIDAHLGFGAESNPTYLHIAPGQSVTVIGMMQSAGAKKVLVARILTTSSRIFVLRNEHGIPVRAIPRRNTRSKTLFAFASGTRCAAPQEITACG